VQGWCSVEELTRWGFEHAQVVMANEAHDGLSRCPRTREVGVRMVRAAHEAGVRRLAMEALPSPEEDTMGPISALRPHWGGYLAQPEMRTLINTALDLGWTLWAYEAEVDIASGAEPAALLTMEFTNWREREQASNLSRVLAAAPDEPLLVWTGGSHACKEAIGEWVPMGCLFPGLAGTDPFVIDQNASVAFKGRSEPWVADLLADLGETLAAHGGSAGILREQAPPPLNSRTGVDAVIVSTENTLT
jgi:hypothetical protein